jgi:hypothetical protein
MATTNTWRGILPTCGTCAACAIRSVQGNFQPTDDIPASYDFTNMRAWVNDFDLSTLQWGQSIYGNFQSPSSTVPDLTGPGGLYTPGAVNTLWDAGTVGASCGWVARTSQATSSDIGTNPPTLKKSQYLLVIPQAYYVVAQTWILSGSPPSCVAHDDGIQLGCTYPQQTDSDYPMIVELGPPPDASGSYYTQFYFLGIINSAAPTGHFPGDCVSIRSLEQQVTLSHIIPDETLHIWNASRTCYASPDDPFTDDAPP